MFLEVNPKVTPCGLTTRGHTFQFNPKDHTLSHIVQCDILESHTPFKCDGRNPLIEWSQPPSPFPLTAKICDSIFQNRTTYDHACAVKTTPLNKSCTEAHCIIIIVHYSCFYERPYNSWNKKDEGFQKISHHNNAQTKLLLEIPTVRKILSNHREK